MTTTSNNKFTEHLQEALTAGHELALELSSQQIGPEHLFYGLAVSRGSIAGELLHKFWSDQKDLSVKQFIAQRQGHNDNIISPGLDNGAKQIIQKAVLIAHTLQHRYVGTEHLLLALLDGNLPSIRQLLILIETSADELKEQLQAILKSTSRFPDVTGAFDNESENTETGLPSLPGLPPTQVFSLELFTTDLTNPELQKNIDPVIGRQDEIDRLIQILSRRTKNNPILLGDPGVGKTAIVEGLAKKIIEGGVPDVLLDKKILTLDLSLVLAGTMYRGEFEQRLKNILSEIKKDPNIILFIDELHTITGAGAAAGSLDAANILKPALARGEIRCIGATTLSEYRKHIETDPALARRFGVIKVEEPTADQTLEILRGLRTNYEIFHRVKISDEALSAAVKLTSRYLTDRFLPDKAIDVIDEAASALRVKQKINPLTQKIKKVEQGLALLRQKKRQAILAEHYQEALDVKTQEDLANQQLDQLRQQLQRQHAKPLGQITQLDIAKVVAQSTGLPISQLTTVERDKILDLEKILNQQIVGQTEAVNQISQAIKRSRTGVGNHARPIGSFIFLGPSGVGKTALAKALAQALFANKSALVKIDMSEFRESFNVSKLIGSPPGYVGYQESGQLTEAVRRRPYSVVLFDEIEKAHPEIFNILLQVMEDGELTDAAGKTIDFRNTIIIMTSNVGLKDFLGYKKIGFAEVSANHNLYEEMKNYLQKSLTDRFRPEFLNRLDQVVFFRPLTDNELIKIAKLQLAELNHRLAEQNLKLIAGPTVIKLLSQIDNEPEGGARGVRKNIQNLIETPLSQALLEKTFSKSTLHLKVKDRQVIFV